MSLKYINILLHVPENICKMSVKFGGCLILFIVYMINKLISVDSSLSYNLCLPQAFVSPCKSGEGSSISDVSLKSEKFQRTKVPRAESGDSIGSMSEDHNLPYR